MVKEDGERGGCQEGVARRGCLVHLNFVLRLRIEKLDHAGLETDLLKRALIQLGRLINGSSKVAVVYDLHF